MLRISSCRAGAASSGRFERGLEGPEDRGLADLIVGCQLRHRRTGSVPLGDLALLANIESGRPTDPRCSSQSAPLMSVDACASVPAYSSQIASGPSQLIHVPFTYDEKAAPKCHTTFNDDTS